MLKWLSHMEYGHVHVPGLFTCFRLSSINQLVLTLFLSVCSHKQEIEEVDTDEHYQPKTPIGIMNIILKQGP